MPITKFQSSYLNNYIVESSLQQYEQKYIAENYSVKVVNSGLERYIINSKEYRLCENNFLVVNPGQEVELVIESEKEVLGKCYFFDPGLIAKVYNSNNNHLSDILDNGFQNSGNEIINIPTHLYGTTFYSLVSQVSKFDLQDENQLNDLLFHLAENLLSHNEILTNGVKSLEGEKKHTKLELYKRIQLGRQFIHDNFASELPLSSMAKAAYLSDYYFHRNFKKYFQLTPYQYLLNIRMNNAQKLFEEDKYSIAEIAIKSGFQDKKYFRKVFKKWLFRNC